MTQIDTDVAIIGAGTAGMAAYQSALDHTSRVVIIEGGELGTTCARVGCMPSKLLIAAAEVSHTVSRAPQFGVYPGDRRIDGAAVMTRVREERDRFVGFVTEAVARWPAENLLRGQARFIDAHSLDVGGHTLVRAQRIVIATGSHAVVPPAWRARLGERLLMSDDVFDWDALPASVAVIGAGVIGLEIAQALHRLGVKARLYGRDARIGPLTDPVLQEMTRQLFPRELALTLDAGAVDVARSAQGVVVRTAGQQEEAHFDYLLVAIGRTANVEALNLVAAGLPLDKKGVPVFDRNTGQVGESHVFIAGDAGNDRLLLHEAAEQGRIAGGNAGRFPEVRAPARRTPLTIVFSDPQIMIAGSSYASLKAAGAEFAVGEVSFEDQGRSRVIGRNQGMMRLYGEPGTGRLLGAEMIGPAAEHIAHLLAWSMQRGETVAQLLEYPFYHPVIEEGVRTALRALRRQLRMGPPPVPRCLDCGPGA